MFLRPDIQRTLQNSRVDDTLVTWLAGNYTKVPVSGQQQTSILKIQFTLSERRAR
jgi:hypothetical protein